MKAHVSKLSPKPLSVTVGPSTSRFGGGEPRWRPVATVETP